jgi:hypothetical protein
MWARAALGLGAVACLQRLEDCAVLLGRVVELLDE